MVGMMANSPMFEPCAYEPPVSLWKLIEQYTPEHERQEIKTVLGESMVEQSLELHEEVDTLLEIWRDFRCQTYSETYQKRLPEPPAVRERLKQEIKFFVDNIRERANRQGLDPEKIFSSHSMVVLDYVLDNPDRSVTPSRPSTTVSKDGRETPMVTSPCSDRVSLASTVSEEVESMNDKLNILEVDEVAHRLRATLEEEISQLVSDISFLQSCLEDEANFRDETTGVRSLEPSITELREERASLEKDMLKTEIPLPSPPPSKLKPAVSPQLRKYTPLSVTANGQNNHIGHSCVSRTSPVKASHDVCSNATPHRTKTDQNSIHRSAASANTGGMRVRVGGSASRAQVVQITAVAGGRCDGDSVGIIPSPPPSSRPKIQRPSSAERFRKMVLQSREGT